MRKLLVSIIALAGVFGLMTPASAQHHVVNCVDRQNGGSVRTICAMVNTNDVYLGEKIEALADYESPPNQNDVISIQFDYVRLYQCIAGTCTQVRGVGATGWMTSPAPGDNGAYSTGWWDICGGSNHDLGTFHVDIRYRIRWEEEPGNPVGDWKFQQTGNSIERCD